MTLQWPDIIIMGDISVVQDGKMNKVIQCPCGYVIRADNDEALVSLAQQHARETHSMELTAEEALAMARPE